MSKKNIKYIPLLIITIIAFTTSILSVNAESYTFETKYFKNGNLSDDECEAIVSSLSTKIGGIWGNVDTVCGPNGSGKFTEDYRLDTILNYQIHLNSTSNNTVSGNDFFKDTYCACYNKTISDSKCNNQSADYKKICGTLNGETQSNSQTNSSEYNCYYTFMPIKSLQQSPVDPNDSYGFQITGKHTGRSGIKILASQSPGARVYTKVIESPSWKVKLGGDTVYFMDGVSHENFAQEFSKYHKENNKCPVLSICLTNGDGDGDSWRMSVGDIANFSNHGCQRTDTLGFNSTVKKDEDRFTPIDDLTTNNFVYKKGMYATCEELISGELKEKLNFYLNILRIAVPILLIVYGVLDFCKAFLATEEGKMKEAQTRMIRRVLIGIAIFFIPTIINLILNVANQVWPSISGGNCGLDFLD